MLFNKNWDKPKTKLDPLSLDDFIAWLETKDPQQIHCFNNVSRCLMAQWAQSIDPDAKSDPKPGNSWLYLVKGEVVNFQGTKLPRVAVNTGSTFGEALAKAKTYRGRT